MLTEIVWRERKESVENVQNIKWERERKIDFLRAKLTPKF